MWNTILLIGAAALLLLVARSLWTKVRNKPRAMKLFARRYVADPAFRESLEEDMEATSLAIDESQNAPPPHASEIPALLDDLLSSDKVRNSVAMIRLEKAGANAEEALLAAFDDPRCVWQRDGSHSLDSAPAERVTFLLSYIPSRLLGDRLAHLVEHQEQYVSGKAIKARAALGREDLLPFVIKHLSDRNACTSAQEGVELGIKQGWVQPAFMNGLLSWAKQTTLDSSIQHAAWAVGFYAQYGGAEAISALQSKSILSLDNNRTIHFAIRELTRYGVAIPLAILAPMIEKSLASEGIWPWEWVFEPALIAMAVTDLQGALRLAESQLDRADGPYSSAAMEFIRRTADLPESWETEPPPGMEVSAEDLRILDDLEACVEVFGQVGNGGLSQYFFNPSGNSWPVAVQALKAIGYSLGADTLFEAAHTFDPRGASLDREMRMKQYAQLSEATEKRLDAMSDVFYSKSSDRVVLRYMLQHQDLYARIKKARRAADLDRDTESGSD